MRALGISAISLAMTAAVVSNAYYQKKQFYPSVVYITKSNPCMAVIYLQSLVLVLMLGKLMRKVFLGSLRAAEFEHLMERFWYALTETCLAFTVFRDDFNPKFVALFTVLLFLKSFHWLAEDRVDFMERSPVIGWLFHVRAVALLSCLGLLDYLMIAHAYTSTIDKGPTVQLVFGFEYAILYTMVANITIKYVLHTTELRADTPWENKAVFLLYTELVIGFIRVVLYALFVVIMVRIYTLPLFAFRPMYYTMRNFKKALNDVIMSRRAIRNMNTLYPDATPEELSQSDNICIICREDMVNSSKKLPCGHIFHTSCLRSWFQRQQTCPTCRLNILRTATPASAAAAPGGAGAAAAAAAARANNQEPNVGVADAAVINNNNNIAPQPDANNIFAFANALPNFPQMPNFAQMPNFQFPQFANLQPPINLQPAAAAAAADAAAAAPNAAAVDATSTTPAAATTSSFAIPPQLPASFLAAPFGGAGVAGVTGGFPLLAPYLLPPPPPMPPALQHLSDTELRRLEGTERQHVEERIRLLRNIQLMLDASVALMNQYTAVVAQLPLPVEPQPAAATTPAASTEPTAPAQQAVAGETAAGPSAGPSGSTEAAASTSTAAAAVDAAPTVSASAAAASATPAKPTDIVTIEDVGSEEPGDSAQASGGDAAAMELRRRRLEKFMRSEQRGE